MKKQNKFESRRNSYKDIVGYINSVNEKSSRHLDYLLYVIGDILSEEDRIAIKKEIKRIKTEIKVYKTPCFNKNRAELSGLKEKLSIVEMMEENYRTFSARAVPKERLNAGKGEVYFFSFGAEIWYSSKKIEGTENTNISNHVVAHIIIAHEVGHILLHSKWGWDKRGDYVRDIDPPIHSKDRRSENEASYFAQKILEHRAKQFLDDGRDEHGNDTGRYYYKKPILEANIGLVEKIKTLQDDYDPAAIENDR
ncbi:MAG: hypothetical protein FWH14_01765 [Oscillospiraceae bacterium]|nr:hypothetical protein [Oscillospiraceae bacterium]